MAGDPAAAADASPEEARPGLAELWWHSLRLGAVGFGGGLTVLSALEQLAVGRRSWVTPAEFESAAAVSQILPGGAAANALALIGLRARGLAGALAAYAAFILPGAAAIVALGWLYTRYGAVARAEVFLNGLNAAVVGVIVALTLRMAKGAVTRLWQMGMAAGALLLSAVGGSSSGELALIGICVGLLVKLGEERGLRFGPAAAAADDEANRPPDAREGASARGAGGVRLQAWVWPVLLAVIVPAIAGRLVVLFTVLFRTGLGAYGGGFAVIPSLQMDARAHGWLTDHQFSDAVAVGKLTPGPVLLMATFIGYVHAGAVGALVATVGIMAGPFLLTVIFGSTLERFRSSAWVQAGLSGLSATVVGLMAAAALTLGAGFHSLAGPAIAAAVALTLVRFPVNPVALLAVGGVLRVVLARWMG